jgi:hypothetical protein
MRHTKLFTEWCVEKLSRALLAFVRKQCWLVTSWLANVHWNGTYILSASWKMLYAGNVNRRNFKNAVLWDVLTLFLQPWRWRRHIPRKHRFIINPHGTTSKKALFIVTAVKTPILHRRNFNIYFASAHFSGAQHEDLWFCLVANRHY